MRNHFRGNSQQLKSTRLNSRNLQPLVVAVFCLFLVVSCKLFTKNSAPANNTGNSNGSTASESKSPSYDREKFQKLLDAGTAIEQMNLPVKRDPQPMLKGKVFVFTNVEASRGKGYDDGISSYRKADSLEELQTAIRVNCRKGKSLGTFQNNSNGIDSRAEGFGIDCEVALIDYPARAIFEQKNFSNNESQDLISSKNVRAGVYLNPPPVGDITRYLNSLPVDRVDPEMTSLDEKELIKLPTTVSLNSDAALKGKIKLARQYEEAHISQAPVIIDGYLSSIFPSSKLATKPEELETLVKIVCGRGDKIGQTGKTAQYSNRCVVSLIDYKSLTVVAQKTIENKSLDTNPSAESAGVKIWVTKFPAAEIESYLKSLPAS
ncbi:MAG TPA: hypothetical protein VJU86_06065 [Pyrinomonadaceae bacterium]|nr:hypothetical protein [Pyrinomonadaceae bacterium]